MSTQDSSQDPLLNTSAPSGSPQEVIISSGFIPRPGKKIGSPPAKSDAPEVSLLPASDALPMEASECAKPIEAGPTISAPETVLTSDLTNPEGEDVGVPLADPKHAKTPLCANATGSSPPRSLPQENTVTKLEIHSFSRPFAETHSVNEAIILKHLAWKVQRSKNHRDGKAWYFASTQELSKKFPYISASAIDANIRKLEASGCLEIGNYNKRKYDKTRWFHVPESYIDEVDEKKIRFDATDAKNHGVGAAVLLHNLRHWMTKKLGSSLNANVVHKMSPAELADRLPYSQATIKATLAQLVKDGVLVKPDAAKPEYTFSPDQMLKLQRKLKLESDG